MMKNIFKNKILIVTISIFLLVAISIGSYFILGESMEEKQYKNAKYHIEKGNYAKAVNIIYDLGDYKDCKELLKKFSFLPRYETFEFAEETGSYTRETKYDDSGNIISFTEDNYNQKIFAEYDNGLKVRETITFKEKNSSTVNLFTYNDENKIIKKDITYSSGNSGFVSYEYNASGLLIKEVENYDDKFFTEYSYSYDKNKNMIKKEYNSFVHEYEYDNNNNLIREVVIDTTSSYTDVDEYEYDENNNLIKETVSNGSYIYEYYYDDSDRLTLKIQKERSQIDSPYYEESRTTYEYDKYGCLVKEISHHSGVYEFDFYVKEISYVVFYKQ